MRQSVRKRNCLGKITAATAWAVVLAASIPAWSQKGRDGADWAAGMAIEIDRLWQWRRRSGGLAVMLASLSHGSGDTMPRALGMNPKHLAGSSLANWSCRAVQSSENQHYSHAPAACPDVPTVLAAGWLRLLQFRDCPWKPRSAQPCRICSHVRNLPLWRPIVAGARTAPAPRQFPIPPPCLDRGHHCPVHTTRSLGAPTGLAHQLTFYQVRGLASPAPNTRPSGHCHI